MTLLTSPLDVPASIAQQLVGSFCRNGYVRRLKVDRRRTEGQKYKKGDEVRLVASSPAELATIRRLLRQAGFKAGRPYVQGRQFRLPLYGRQQVARFLAMVASQRAVAADAATPRERR